MTDVSFQCRCGEVRGHGRRVDAPRGNRITCYCADCRAFARSCGGDALDASGGLDMYQMTVGRIEIEAGIERLAARRMTKRGPVRWYASCCDTALVNCLASPTIPYASIITAGVPDGERERAFGPPVGALFSDRALGKPLVKPIGGAGMFALAATFLRNVWTARRRGEHRNSPLHRNGGPIVEPTVPTGAERERLYA